MSQFATAKNPPWVRNTGNANITQPPPPGTSITTSILAAQATHAPTAAATAGQLAAAGVPAGTLATAAAVVAAAQNQQAQQTPVVSAAYGTGLAALTLTQSALQQGAVLQQQGIAIPASLSATTQVNSGVVVEIARLPQPGVALPTSLATTQVATVSYPAPRLLAQTAQFQATQPHPHQAAAAAVVQQAAAQPQAQPQALKQRVFTGTVTKLHENFGFVDEDVFFQISAVKGNLPKAGERVLVEAAYNPNMPFKWNATRIQVLPNQMCQVNVQPANNSRAALAQVSPMVTSVLTAPVSVGLTLPAGVSINNPVANLATTPQFTSLSQQSRWQVQPEMTVIEPLGQPRLNVQYENRLDGPHPWIQDIEYSDMIENKGPRLPMIPRRHSPPPSSRRDRERERDGRRDDRRERYRERERYSPPPRKRSRSPRRPSRSPPRRRQRLAPRYTVQIPKISLDVREGNVIELRKRYANLYIPSDFCSASFLWQDTFPSHQPFSLDHPCTFHIMNKDDPMIETEVSNEPSDTDYAYSAKVMLLATPPLREIFKKSCALAEDPEEVKENFVHPTRLISFLVGLKGKNETVAIGGPWSPSLDGPNPDKDPSVLIRTAIRTCKALTNIDLSKCSQWYRFAEIYYRRGETTHKGRVLPTRVETVVLFLPDVWSCLPTRVEWDGLLEGYKKQLLKKLHEEQPPNTSTTQGEENGEQTEKKEPTHFASLDPNTLYVSDLKRELDARNLSTKGLKSQLVARLTKALKTEHEQAVVDENASDEENAANEEGDEPVDEEEKKKEEEEEEKRQKEEKEISVLIKKLQMPESPAVIVHPSRTAKNGKFDCTIMSLSLLLDYRQEDNKEHSFEVSLFAELFNEMMMRDFGFRIYRSLVEAPDLKDEDKDKKKNDKKDDLKYKKDDKDEYRKKDDVDDSERDDDDSDDEEFDGDEKKDRERKRKKKKKLQMYTHDPFLLLSYIYFDQTHCGHLLDKDVEEVLFTLGLHLSRAQARKLVQKVSKRDMLRYRKLTDKPVTETDKPVNSCSNKVNLEELAAGNKRFMPTFGCMQDDDAEQNDCEMKEENGATVTESAVKTPLVLHHGAMVDVGKLLMQLDRSEKARIDIEQRLKSLEDELDGVQELASNRDKQSQKLAVDLEEQQCKLQNTEEELRRSLIQSEKYQRALSTCRDQLQAAMSIVDNTLRSKPMRSSRNNGSSYLKKDLDSSNSRPMARESSSQTTFKARDVSKASRGCDSDDLIKPNDQPKIKDSSTSDHETKMDEMNAD